MKNECESMSASFSSMREEFNKFMEDCFVDFSQKLISKILLDLSEVIRKTILNSNDYFLGHQRTEDFEYSLQLKDEKYIHKKYPIEKIQDNHTTLGECSSEIELSPTEALLIICKELEFNANNVGALDKDELLKFIRNEVK